MSMPCFLSKCNHLRCDKLALEYFIFKYKVFKENHKPLHLPGCCRLPTLLYLISLILTLSNDEYCIFLDTFAFSKWLFL